MRSVVAQLRCATVVLVAATAARAENPAATEDVVVTGARQAVPAADSPAPVAVIARPILEGGKALDEALRTEPSFALFRRSSSLVADPSSQGVNLRGIGPSGVSRALVLEDGVPLNDGFGGWVYWGSVPRSSLDRVEIAPGASSALYGSAALGGVVQLVGRPIRDRAEVEVQGGSFATGMAALSIGRKREAISTALDLEGLRTSGYDVVARPGAIDHAASSSRASARAHLEANVADDTVLSVRAGGFVEDEDGGTRYTTAAVRQGLVSLGLSTAHLDVRAFARLSRFDQDRSRILPDASTRATEELASSQQAPSDDQGMSVLWRAARFTVGVDLRRAFGRSIEDIRPPGSASGAVVGRRASGEQQQGGVFAEHLGDVASWLQVQAAVRADAWRNAGGSRLEQLASGTLQVTAVPDRSDAQLSSRLALRARATPWLAFRAAGYRSFRAPTLNELYRPFQVGPVRTEANPELGPETLLGGEAGFDAGARAYWLQATAFVSRLDHPIVNVTVGPNQQQRQNLGSARIAGLELRGRWSPVRAVRLSAAWTFADSRVSSADLEGRQLPQDPRHRVSGRIDLEDVHGFSGALEVRWIGDQFEDDRNELKLPGFAVVDASVSRPLSDRVTVFIAAENALDRRYLVGLQGGIATVGQPLCVRGGVRVSAF